MRQIHMDETLEFWVDAQAQFVKADKYRLNRSKTYRLILQQFENRGFARRRLDCDGNERWEATSRMHEHIREGELDAEHDDEVFEDVT